MKEEVPKVEAKKVNRVDLGELVTSPDVPIIAGRERGKYSREKFQLDELDKSDGIVVVAFPSQIESLNISFFLSFFGKSVRTLGKEKFLEKYQFECSDEVKATFISFVDTALKNNSSPIV